MGIRTEDRLLRKMANKFSANEEKWEIIGPRFLGDLERKEEELSFSIGEILLASHVSNKEDQGIFNQGIMVSFVSYEE